MLLSPWWRSGWSIHEDGTEETIFVAAVRADTEDEAFSIIEEAYDTKPENGVPRRFAKKLDEATLPWQKEDTRFPFGDWMEWTDA